MILEMSESLRNTSRWYPSLEAGVEKPLRIGILIDAWSQPAWIARILDDLAACGFCSVCLFVLNLETPTRLGFLKKFRRHYRNLFYILYTRWDSRQFASDNDPFEMVDVSIGHADIPCLEVMPIRKGFVHRFSDQDISRIRDFDLDVILRFGFNVIRGDILESARFGVWSYHHGDNRLYRGGPALFWEIYEKNPLSGTILQVLNEKLDAGRILYRSHASTDLVSQARNRRSIYWKTSAFVL